MVQSGAMSKHKAALSFGVQVSGKAPLGSKPGKPTVLTAAKESVLVKYCILMASIGYPLKRQELLFEVKKVLDHDGRPTSFKENLPGNIGIRGLQNNTLG